MIPKLNILSPATLRKKALAGLLIYSNAPNSIRQITTLKIFKLDDITVKIGDDLFDELGDLFITLVPVVSQPSLQKDKRVIS